MNIKSLKDALEHSPEAESKAIGLIGFWHEDESGLFFVCSKCAARILARGVSLNPATPVWENSDQPFGQCVCCK